jgi:hypothetical protein
MNSSNSWSPAITHEDILAETQRNQLIEELRSAIRDIIGGILFKPDIVIEDSPLSVALFSSIERILLYRLQVPPTELLTHLINSSTSRPNNNLSIRNWIVFALNNKTLVPAVTDVIKRLESDPIVNRLYDSKAILLNEECAQLLVSLLSGLSCINFKLSDFAAEEQTASIYEDRQVTEDKPKQIPTKKHKKRTNIIILDQ